MVINALGSLLTVLGVVALAGFGVWAIIGLIAAGEWVRDRYGTSDPGEYERYQAEQAIHSIRRQAIHDMLEAERDHRHAYDLEVIEGTAVEVRR